MARISISEVNFPPLCLSLKSSRPLPRSIAIYSVAVVAAGLAVVMAAGAVGAARVGLCEAGGKSKGDEGEKRFHVSSGSCFCMLGSELTGG